MKGRIVKRRELEAFQEWLISQDYKIDPCKGLHELLRWSNSEEPGRAKPIVFARDKTPDNMTLNHEALQYWIDWKNGWT
jgi:hypothetical protein